MSSSESQQIALPSGHKLHCWKIRCGSAVRIGETVALAAPITATTGTDNDVLHETRETVAPKPAHKRPTRRKRPLPNKSVAESSNKVNASLKAPSVASLISAATSTAAFQTTRSSTDKCNGTAQAATTNKVDQVAIVAKADGILRIVDSTDDGVIGYIYSCQHPTVIEGMCAVCGMRPGSAAIDRASTESSSNASSKMSRMTVSGLTVSVSEEEGQRMAQQDASRLQQQRKLSLVLDLDHTLVHATPDPRAAGFEHEDVRRLVLAVPAPQPQVWYQHHYVKLRPHVKEFLTSTMQNYELGVYTAGTREYAEQIAIVLARHLVGAKLDDVELDHLRRQVAEAELQLHGFSTKTPEERGDQDEPTQGEKRKRVTFEETPASAKTDQIKKEQVDELHARLAAAEPLEREALKFRQKLFGSRIVSRTEAGDLGRDVKSLFRIFPCGGAMAAVIDDRDDVWANAQDINSTRPGEPPDNLLLVRPYHWSAFAGFADVNNASGADYTGQPYDQESDEQLLWIADILKKLHQRYYSQRILGQQSVAEILSQIRSEVLRGSHIVLSSLVPLSKQQLPPNAPRPDYVRFVENLGATLQSSVTMSTTHVVAGKDGTEKILAARRVKGCHVVGVSWLMECFWSLTWRDETQHTLRAASAEKRAAADVARGEAKEGSVLPLVDSTRDNSSNSSSSDEEDDEFLADLERELTADPSNS